MIIKSFCRNDTGACLKAFQAHPMQKLFFFAGADESPATAAGSYCWNELRFAGKEWEKI